MTGVSRRFPPDVPKLAERVWNDVRGPLERYLRSLKDNISGIPGGFKDSDPTQIQAGVDSDPGTESASWAAADHVHDVETAAPTHPTGTVASEGTGSALMLADATIQQGIVTTKGDILTYSNVPIRLAVGATNGMGLEVDSAEATGLKWTNRASDAEILAWLL